MDEHSYDDIINLPNPTSKNHPRMSLHDRAAQFAPFAALTGHDAAIKETARLTDERLELSDEVIMKLNDQLNMIRDNIGTEQEILSGSVCAYRKETVKPRFIRIDEVMALLDVTQDEAMDIALAAGARYQLAKIILVHKERLMKFMKHSARVPSSNKIVEKKFVRIGEGSMTYSIGHHRFIEMARAAGAVYKIGEAKGNTILINLEVFDEYMEQFREPPTEMKHPLPNVKGD